MLGLGLWQVRGGTCAKRAAKICYESEIRVNPTPSRHHPASLLHASLLPSFRQIDGTGTSKFALTMRPCYQKSHTQKIKLLPFKGTLPAAW